MSEAEEVKEWKLIPEGEHIVLLDSYEEKPNSKGTGHRATMIFKISKGDLKDKKLFLDLNVSLPASPAAEKVATSMLNKFLIATKQADNGLESIGHNRDAIKDFINEGSVLAIVKHKEKKAYVNKDGVQVPAKMRAEIVSFKAR